MNPQLPSRYTPVADSSIVRDVATGIFRFQRTLVAACAVFTVLVIAVICLLPRIYQSELELLVRNARSPLEVGPYTSPSQNAAEIPVTDSQIGTEIQLLSSHDLHQEVVKAIDGSATPSPEVFARKVKDFESHLKLTPVAKTDLIRVTFSGAAPRAVHDTVSLLANRYLDYHARLEGGSHVYTFFQQETERYRKQLEEARQALVKYGEKQQVASLPEQKDLSLRELVQARDSLDGVIAQLGEEQTRVEKLSSELDGLSPRLVTQQRAVPSQYSAEHLSTMLQELKNKRTSLLTQFRPDDRRVTEVDKQIAETEAAAEEAEKQHSTEETTDVNPIRMSMETELAKARVAAAALRSKQQSIVSQLSAHEKQVSTLNSATAEYDERELAIKRAEDTYTLYARKAEEARISDALDADKIANVVISDGPSLPVRPNPRFGLTQIAFLLLGNLIIAGLISAYAMRHTALYTRQEIETFTGIPVLASVPFEKYIAQNAFRSTPELEAGTTT